MRFGSKLLETLDEIGADTATDLDDGLDGYFGWRVFYQDGNLCLRVTFEDHQNEGYDPSDDGSKIIETEQTWILTPL